LFGLNSSHPTLTATAPYFPHPLMDDEMFTPATQVLPLKVTNQGLTLGGD